MKIADKDDEIIPDDAILDTNYGEIEEKWCGNAGGYYSEEYCGNCIYRE